MQQEQRNRSALQNALFSALLQTTDSLRCLVSLWEGLSSGTVMRVWELAKIWLCDLRSESLCTAVHPQNVLQANFEMLTYTAISSCTPEQPVMGQAVRPVLQVGCQMIGHLDSLQCWCDDEHRTRMHACVYRNHTPDSRRRYLVDI